MREFFEFFSNCKTAYGTRGDEAKDIYKNGHALLYLRQLFWIVGFTKLESIELNELN
jgi:hypothetical protein